MASGVPRDLMRINYHALPDLLQTWSMMHITKARWTTHYVEYWFPSAAWKGRGGFLDCDYWSHWIRLQERLDQISDVQVRARLKSAVHRAATTFISTFKILPFRGEQRGPSTNTKPESVWLMSHFDSFGPRWFSNDGNPRNYPRIQLAFNITTPENLAYFKSDLVHRKPDSRQLMGTPLSGFHERRVGSCTAFPLPVPFCQEWMEENWHRVIPEDVLVKQTGSVKEQAQLEGKRDTGQGHDWWTDHDPATCSVCMSWRQHKRRVETEASRWNGRAMGRSYDPQRFGLWGLWAVGPQGQEYAFPKDVSLDSACLSEWLRKRKMAQLRAKATSKEIAFKKIKSKV